MSRLTFGLFALALGVTLSACDESGADAAASAAKPAASAPAAATLSDDDVPVPADFDDEAERHISSANYKAELDALEAEIGKP